MIDHLGEKRSTWSPKVCFTRGTRLECHNDYTDSAVKFKPFHDNARRAKSDKCTGWRRIRQIGGTCWYFSVVNAIMNSPTLLSDIKRLSAKRINSDAPVLDASSCATEVRTQSLLRTIVGAFKRPTLTSALDSFIDLLINQKLPKKGEIDAMMIETNQRPDNVVMQILNSLPEIEYERVYNKHGIVTPEVPHKYLLSTYDAENEITILTSGVPEIDGYAVEHCTVVLTGSEEIICHSVAGVKYCGLYFLVNSHETRGNLSAFEWNKPIDADACVRLSDIFGTKITSAGVAYVLYVRDSDREPVTGAHYKSRE